MSEPQPGVQGGMQGAVPGLRCDFCGEEVARVRRVALDRGYERLRTPHRVQYACPRCSEEKERRRLGERVDPRRALP